MDAGDWKSDVSSITISVEFEMLYGVIPEKIPKPIGYFYLKEIREMISSIKDCAVLNNGLEMPWLGFGVFKMSDGQEVEQAIHHALEAGYRSIDTATVYKNEIGTGKATRESGIPREDIFLTPRYGIVTSARSAQWQPLRKAWSAWEPIM
jgi:hypothetical protein